MRAIGRFVMMSVVMIGLMPLNARAQAVRSADAATLLAKLLDAQQLDEVAAQDPDHPGRFIAALYFPQSQLLVIDAEYPVPVLLEQRLERGEFRQIYVDLQSATPPVSRFFVHDSRCKSSDRFHRRRSGQPWRNIERPDTISSVVVLGIRRTSRELSRGLEWLFASAASRSALRGWSHVCSR